MGCENNLYPVLNPYDGGLIGSFNPHRIQAHSHFLYNNISTAGGAGEFQLARDYYYLAVLSTETGSTGGAETAGAWIAKAMYILY